MITNSIARKQIPMARGLLDYFPDALAAVAQLSLAANEKHNPGEELHHSRGKSSDHADCLIRHLVERGKMDDDGFLHDVKVAWRALAILQEECESRGANLARAARLPGWDRVPETDGPDSFLYVGEEDGPEKVPEWEPGQVQSDPICMADLDRAFGVKDDGHLMDTQRYAEPYLPDDFPFEVSRSLRVSALDPSETGPAQVTQDDRARTRLEDAIESSARWNAAEATRASEKLLEERMEDLAQQRIDSMIDDECAAFVPETLRDVLQERWKADDILTHASGYFTARYGCDGKLYRCDEHGNMAPTPLTVRP